MFLYEALAAMGIGYLIGLGLDKLFGFEMLFKAIFLVIGILAAVRNLIVKALKLGEELDE
ncbi:AtpZ/AtpI family protein [Candidatus Izimaplasma bacterium ZiA1]|uniref:AtpZ/AtpI family protein n=1 Tax=Candidatus Izimoplasma sp. ZiA1 TaxID=2024899 RepID=UPI00117899CB